MEFNEEEIFKIKEITSRFEEFRKEILSIDYIHNKIDFFDIMKSFRKYIVEINENNNFDFFYHSKNYKFYKDFFTKTHEYYLRSLESMQALSVMTQWIHDYNSFAELMDKDLLRETFERKWREIKSLNFENANNFTFAWSWPFPETMLYIYENTKIDNILWLDYNHEAIYMSWEMVSWLGLKKIKFKQCDAREFDYSSSDIVFIPLFVPMKKEVIEQIIKTWNNNVQILVANPKWFLNLIYEEIGEINNRLKISYREDLSTEFVTQEIIKLEKYDF